MTEKLSSAATLLYKVVFPAIWIPGFGLGTLAMWLGKFDQTSQPRDDHRLISLVLWIVGSTILSLYALRIKTVIIDKDTLVVKNFVRSIRVPLRNIKDIRQARFVRSRAIYLSIYPPTEFGKTIIFIPKAKFKKTFNPFSEHPIVTRLRELSGVKE